MNSHSVPNATVGFPGKPANGGSNPRWYHFDDDVTRLVKWHPSNHGQKACYNELVASRLGQLIGAPILRGGIVYLSDRIIPADHRAFGAREGFHFAVTRMEGENFLPAHHYGEIENSSQLPAAAVHLAWLGVGDQEGHNQFLHRREATSIGGQKQIRFMLVDMGFMFGTPNWTAATLAGLPQSFRLPVHVADRLTLDKLDGSMSVVEQLHEDDIRACFMDRPGEWGIPQADIDAGVTLAVARKSSIRGIIRTGNPAIKDR